MEDGDYDINLIDIWEMTIKPSQMASFPVSPALCGNLCVVHNSAPEAAFGARLPGEPWHAVRVPNAQAKGWVRSVQMTALRPAANWFIPLLSDSNLRAVRTMAHSIPDVLKAFAAGEIVVVTDDDDREGEGDLIVAASLCTADQMAFIVRHTSGIVCAPVTSEDARRLRLDPMVAHNDSNYSTAFTVSIDYKPGMTTGISAEERTATCRALVNSNVGPNDLARPGHIFPLIARDGGVLLRSGHTEAAIDLCRLSGLPLVGILSELMNDDGTVMKGEQVGAFADKHKLKHVTIADLIAYRQAREKLIERVSSFTVESPIGPLEGHAYRSPFDEIFHLALVYGSIGDGKNVLTRFHKPNIVKDLFRGPQRVLKALDHFKKRRSGVLVYLRDGAAGVPVEPLAERSSVDADRTRQWREVGVGAQILRDLGVSSICNLSSSGHEYKGLAGFGIEIAGSEPFEG